MNIHLHINLIRKLSYIVAVINNDLIFVIKSSLNIYLVQMRTVIMINSILQARSQVPPG